MASVLMKVMVGFAFVAGFFLITCASIAIHLASQTEPSETYKDFVKIFGGFSIILASLSLLFSGGATYAWWNGRDLN